VIYTLLAQASGLESEMAQHPYVTVAIVTVLCGLLLASWKYSLFTFEKRINEKFGEIEKKADGHDTRLDAIEKDLRTYEKHVAVGTLETSEIHAAVKRTEQAINSHVEKEEGTTWKKIDVLVDAINNMKLSNELAHAGMVSGQLALGVRIESVEKKMPNGELEKLAIAYHDLARRETDSVTKIPGVMKSRRKAK
jgi:hypothetical protein